MLRLKSDPLSLSRGPVHSSPRPLTRFPACRTPMVGDAEDGADLSHPVVDGFLCFLIPALMLIVACALRLEEPPPHRPAHTTRLAPAPGATAASCQRRSPAAAEHELARPAERRSSSLLCRQRGPAAQLQGGGTRVSVRAPRWRHTRPRVSSRRRAPHRRELLDSELPGSPFCFVRICCMV